MSNFETLNAEVVAPESITVPRLRSLVTALESGCIPFVRPVSVIRLPNGAEGITLDAEVELGQEPPVPLHRSERVAILFKKADESYPEVLALRSDFPHVPHLNCGDTDLPRSLCLYEDPWSEVRLRWTPSGFIERIRTWFALTAEAKLHGDDQPLEPLLFANSWRLVIPSDLFAAPPDKPETLSVFKATDDIRANVLMALRAVPGQQSPVAFVATTFHTAPQQHGLIRRQPRTIADLASLVEGSGLDLLAELRHRLKSWGTAADRRKAPLIMVIYFPKTRTTGGTIEAGDIWSFVTECAIEELGKRLGLWELSGSHIASLLSPDLSRTGQDVRVDVLNTSFALSRAQAAAFNGTTPSEVKITAVGAGALGSQTIPKLLQCGFGRWTVIDDDHLLPHNGARHQFPPNYLVGQPKAEVMAQFGDSIFEGTGDMRAVVANVLTPGDKETQVASAFQEAEVIIDFSASVAVGRHLARRSDKARRISVFLNPSGTDLVVLAEDQARSATIDYLEMIYYGEVATDVRLASHLARSEGRVRYARSCRDLTSVVPEDLVGLHSAIASRAIRQVLSGDDAGIHVWKADNSLAVEHISLAVPQLIEVASFDGWRLVTTEALLAKVHSLRKAKLPNETGGVFIGHFDTESKVAYIVDTLPAPPDSKEYPVHYIRGSAGLKTAIEGIKKRTSTMLHYVGEWHSHPNGYSCTPSTDDHKVFSWLTQWMQIDGYPGLMLIAGEREQVWFVGRME